MNDTTRTIEYSNEIREWFSSDRDFDRGFNLFVRFSHNRALAIQLARKRTQSKLEYELEKILERTTIIERAVMPITVMVKTENEIKTQKTKREKEKKIVVVDNKIDFDSLSPEKKEIYLENRKLHNELRSFHEKMKLATSDEQRAEYRNQVEQIDDRIRENWKAFDGEIINEVKEVKEQDPVKMVTNARSYISKQLPRLETLKGEKLQKAKDKVREHYLVIIEAKQTLSTETIEKLKKHGVIMDK